jgi:hypothetical protein
MGRGDTERRRGRRIPLQASLLIRRSGEPAPREHTIQNISLAGAYFETEEPAGLAANELILASVSIPESERRTFPFARLAGRSRVVRVHELPAAPGQGATRFGVALEFGRDVTALTAIPTPR